jgi:hypothetical protein
MVGLLFIEKVINQKQIRIGNVKYFSAPGAL